MKKILFFAATAMLFAACANEEALAPQTAEVAANAISFDTYTASATRAGDPEGVMTTDKLKTAGKGFGVFAFHHDNTTYPANNTTLAPNFMYNEHVHWNGAWTYSPLKYWPNETGIDSQTENGPAESQDSPKNRVDRLTFFAYAPYVNLTTPGDMWATSDAKAYVDDASGATGIVGITRESIAGDPKIVWKFSSNLDNNVDLLWGVAPMGMAYQSVNPTNPADPGYVNKTFGLPLLDMLKPDKDQKMKFLFDHALSRIGLSVVSAVDQIAAGDDGTVFDKDDTRVLIEEVKIWGDFNTVGVLNLNNITTNVAKWDMVTKSTSTADAPLLRFDNGTATAPLEANGYIAKELRYETTQIDAAKTAVAGFGGLNEGVLPSEKILLSGGADPSKKATDLSYEYGKTLYTLSSTDYVRATTTATEDVDTYKKDASDNYTQVKTAGTGAQVMDGSTKYYKLTLTGKVASTEPIANNAYYYKRSGSAGSWVYTKHQNTTGADDNTAGTYYDIAETELSGEAYTGTCYTALMPRYFMVIPSDLTPTPTTINVRIKYHVVTKDGKLKDNISDVTNEITKQTKIQLENGKAYNLKLILGLTSVKLDATVADWQVDGSNEIYLPQNNE